MPQVPAVTILVIAATRTYRSPVDFASETTADMSDILSFQIYPCSLCSTSQASSRIFSRTKGTPPAHTPVARIGVNVHAVYKQYPPFVDELSECY